MRHGYALVTVLVALLCQMPAAPAFGQPRDSAALFREIRQLYQQGNYGEALPFAQTYTDLLRCQVGEADDRTQVAQKNLIEILESAAALAEAQGATDRSIGIRLQALSVAEQAFGADGLKGASILAVIGQQYQRWINSEPVNADSQHVIDDAIGRMLAEIYPTLGTRPGDADARAQSDLASASEQMLRKALAIREKHLPPDDPDVLASLKQLGDLLEFQGRYREASEVHRRLPLPPAPALGLRIEFGGASAPGSVVFFGTDRRPDPGQPGSYGSERGDGNSVGAAIVDFLAPPARQEAAATRDGLLKAVDARRMRIARIQMLDEGAMRNDVRSKVQLATRYPRQAVVFVHGFNVSFDNALLRTAQMAHDLDFDGPAFFYSWPSHGKMAEADYFADQKNSLLAADDLRAFLEFVVAKSGASHVHLIAHSMGNPLLLKALALLKQRPDGAGLHIGQVLLAAPDMDAQDFTAAIPLLRDVAAGITLYASASDRALVVSRLVNGAANPRAGFVGREGPVVVEGVDTADISAASPDILSLNHNAFAESAVLLGDIGKLLHGVRPPDQREPAMRPVRGKNGAYWQFQPGGE